MKSPLVSVLMTAYNREKYIAEAVESVLASSFGDFELIIVDDASQDDTVEVARSYCSDRRVKVVVNPKNLGDYPNRNYAAKLASGKYLKYVDSDDIIYPHGLEIMVRAMENFSEATLAMMQPPAPNVIYPVQVAPAEVYRAHFLGGGFLDHTPTAVILRTAAFRKAGGFSGRRYVGDSEMWLKMAARSPVVKLMEGLVWWRNHGDQEFALGHSSLGYSILSYVVACESLKSIECPLIESERQTALRMIKRGHARHIIRLILRRRFTDAEKILRESNFRWIDVLLYSKRT